MTRTRKTRMTRIRKTRHRRKVLRILKFKALATKKRIVLPTVFVLILTKKELSLSCKANRRALTTTTPGDWRPNATLQFNLKNVQAQSTTGSWPQIYFFIVGGVTELTMNVLQDLCSRRIRTVRQLFAYNVVVAHPTWCRRRCKDYSMAVALWSCLYCSCG